MCARSWILPEQASFRNMLMWIILFCSGKWIVLAVVIRFFASVLMWMFATAPDMSIHNPWRNWHEPQHFMNKYNSATVVESTVFLIFWHSWSIRLRYDIPSFDDRLCDSAKKHCHASLWRSIFVISVGGIRKSNYSQRSCEWPELKFHWLWLELSCQLVESFHITSCWRSCLWSTSGKLVATLKLCPTLQPIYLSQKASVPCMHCRCTVEIFLRVPLYRDLLQFLNSFFLANINVQSWLRILRPTKSLSCEGHIIPVFWTNMENLSKSG